jgi:hypothetical protein
MDFSFEPIRESRQRHGERPVIVVARGVDRALLLDLVDNYPRDFDAFGDWEPPDRMEQRPDVGLCRPLVPDIDGQLQYLCKRTPSVADLATGRFAPRM